MREYDPERQQLPEQDQTQITNPDIYPQFCIPSWAEDNFPSPTGISYHLLGSSSLLKAVMVV